MISPQRPLFCRVSQAASQDNVLHPLFHSLISLRLQVLSEWSSTLAKLEESNCIIGRFKLATLFASANWTKGHKQCSCPWARTLPASGGAKSTGGRQVPVTSSGQRQDWQQNKHPFSLSVCLSVSVGTNLTPAYYCQSVELVSQSVSVCSDS